MTLKKLHVGLSPTDMGVYMKVLHRGRFAKPLYNAHIEGASQSP